MAERIAAICPPAPTAAPPQDATAPPTPRQQAPSGGGGAVGADASPTGPLLDESLVVSPPHQPLPPPAAAPAVPRDPRLRPREPPAQQQAQQQQPPAAAAAAGQRLSVRFIEPDEGERCQHTTYFASHPYDTPEMVGGARGTPCLHCASDAWELRCQRCGRCETCARRIFCKGAERRDNVEAAAVHGHIQRLADRMDRAVWAAFRGEDDFLPIYALIGAGVNPNYLRTHKKETALMAAAYRGNAEAVAELLRLGADPSLCTLDDMTALTFALKRGDQPTIDLVKAALQRQQQQLAAASASAAAS